jgi:hypothetical protein
MKSFMFILSLFVAISVPSYAEESFESATTVPYITTDAKVGINLLSSFLTDNGATKNRISFSGGLSGNLFFSNNVGVFLGLDYATRGYESVGGLKYTATWLDAPFGLVFSHRGLILSEVKMATKLGGFYAQPLGDLSTSGSSSVFNTTTRRSAGLYVASDSFFTVTPTFELGYSVWVKWGLSEAFEQPNFNELETIMEIGMGLAARADLF